MDGQLEILAPFAKGIDLRDSVLKYKNGNFVELEKILESFPNADKIISPLNSKITSQTVKNLLKIPHFAKLKYFIVKNVPEEFDIERFFIYIKTSQYTSIGLIFSKNSISEAYQNRHKPIY
uniref:Uncharacterized protein n=1 Tax=Panagrolaimus sp. PS1159 TaxID=55785 RepID=A0AC35G5E8_9BILA